MVAGYNLKVSFVDCRSTYRNIIISKNSTFGDVSRTIQKFMPWDGSKGHIFIVVVGTETVSIGPSGRYDLDEEATYLSKYDSNHIGYIYDLERKHILSVKFLKDKVMKDDEPVLLKESGTAPE